MGSKKHKKHKSESREKNAGTGTDYEQDSGIEEKRPKLVLNLKVGAGGPSQESALDVPTSPQAEERKHKHKKKKKKKSSEKERERSRYVEEAPQNTQPKRAYEEDESEDEEEDDDEKDEVPHQQYTEMEEESDGNSSPSRRLRDRPSVRDEDAAILKLMLNYLIKNLQNKDVHGFFAFPVTDNIAPGYSAIIHNPMDFSSMATKIENAEYKTVMEFKKDFILMCNNAMQYNRMDTIYYKEAKRLLHLGIKQLSKEKLLHVKKTHSYLASISLQELGFDESCHYVEHVPPPPVEETKEKLRIEPSVDVDSGKVDAAVEEEIPPEEILAQAQEAAAKAKNALTTRRPKTDFGFLRQEDDGTTSMTISNPWNDGTVSSTQKVISLGDYMGKLKNGSGSLFKFKEDKRNKVCPETYLCYGPFSSHAPSYDSSFASCTKEESDLLLGTYGGEVGVQYAKSVERFVENAGYSAVEMVDKLLDTLTNGQHSKAQQIQEEQKRRAEELAEKALQDEMIAKAQKAAEEVEKVRAPRDPVQRKLNETAAILSELSDTQKARLSQEPPPHLSFITPPSDKETNLAHKVTDNLVTMAKQVYPGNVVSTGAVRTAMGITKFPGGKTQQGHGQTGASPNLVANRSRPPTVLDGSEDDSDDDDDDDDDDDEDDDEDDEEEEPPGPQQSRLSDNRSDNVAGVGGASFSSGAEGLGSTGFEMETV